MVLNSFLTLSDPESSAGSALANDLKAFRLNLPTRRRIHPFSSSHRIPLVDFKTVILPIKIRLFGYSDRA